MSPNAPPIRADHLRVNRRNQGKHGAHHRLHKLAGDVGQTIEHFSERHLRVLSATLPEHATACKEHLEHRTKILLEESLRVKPLNFWQRKVGTKRLSVEITFAGVHEWTSFLLQVIRGFHDQLHVNCSGVSQLGVLLPLLRNMEHIVERRLEDLNQLAQETLQLKEFTRN